jgi:hypothetical protein
MTEQKREVTNLKSSNIQCSAATNHLITNAVFNLSSDGAMLAIGLPMFVRMHLPWQKKVPLVLIFSLGIFVVLAAILNKVCAVSIDTRCHAKQHIDKIYSFTEPFGAEWTFWYVRESSTALLVANLPFLSTLWKSVLGGSRGPAHQTRGVDIAAPFNRNSPEAVPIPVAYPQTSEQMPLDLPTDSHDCQPKVESATQATSMSGQSTVPSSHSHRSIRSFL